MDFLEESKYCNYIITPEGWGDTSIYDPDYRVDPNIISGYGYSPPALPDYYNVPITRTNEPVMRYPDEDEQYYSPEDKKIWDEQHKVTYTPPDVPYTPPDDTKIPPEITQQKGFELEEFIKKPEVMGIGVLIAIVLIIKFI